MGEWDKGIHLSNAPCGPPLSGWRRCCSFWRNSDVQTRVKVARRLCRIKHFCQICPCRQRRQFTPFSRPLETLRPLQNTRAGGAWFWVIGRSRISPAGKKRARGSFTPALRGCLGCRSFIGADCSLCPASCAMALWTLDLRNVLGSATSGDKTNPGCYRPKKPQRRALRLPAHPRATIFGGLHLFPKESRRLFHSGSKPSGCLSFMVHIVPVSGPVAQQDFGDR